ncbi:RNA polymerase sigma-70 factor (ECF subfamily) [Kineococcus radiotolerans]|uniref:RNA polymerase, sigma-24 subunit, ECF subfamily n=2 Tax=Kineococcus radiotolerans TaxID=131568 RepID=A6WGM1_KINRD|nr:RNA polymerase sigma factor SigM [Kineococcus radiotolerans]ABS05960.1 RNA polymerase, sigma-24 subunit, ECF subfamily [Kineococcus radiotolerans SRS30216 = ATCC BAA-149]MBB2901389.1 RNA polymerase sigma-70 factor (ECF subfamily) [Kineococcus radiotolerans]
MTPAGPGAPVDPRSDAELLAAHVAGDPEAFGEVVRRHRDRLWAVALRTTGDREEAADALQDALVSALRAAGRFRGESAVTTWLHRIVVNACLDRARRRAVRPTRPLEEEVGPGGEESARTGAALAVAEDATPHVETALDVTSALARLPEAQRAALVLVDMYDVPVAEAAAILDVAVGTVKSRCSRGRAALAELLGGPGNR